jgi:hypothetical protein
MRIEGGRASASPYGSAPIRFLTVVVWLAVLGPVARAQTSAPPYRLVDLMPRYWAFREATRGTPVAEQIRRFRAEVIAAEPRFYQQVIGPTDDARVSRFLTTMERYDSAARRLGAELPAALPLSWQRLRRLFPDLAPGVRIFVVPSVFTSNGQVRYLDDSMVVMLGPDVSAYVEVAIDSGRRTPPELNLEHELAHYHHWGHNPEIARAAKTFFEPGASAQLYYNLWSEGLATYVARRLNPDVPLGWVLGPGLDPVAHQAIVPGLAREFLAKLDSRSETDVPDLFYLSGRRKDIPARSAYYLGYLVVERLAQRYSLTELVRLGGPLLRREIGQALTAIAEGS